MESIQRLEFFFFFPVVLAYASACFLFFMFRNRLWVPQLILPTSARRSEIWYALGVCAAILMIGQLYANGYLIPLSENPWQNALSWNLNNLLIYSPVFLLLLLRKQRLDTVYLSLQGWPYKLMFGCLASAVAVLVFIALRWEWGRLPDIVTSAFSPKSLQYFLPIFLESLTLSLLFIRLKWSLRLSAAITIPCLVFALAHVPNMIAEDRSMMHIISFSLITMGITSFVLYTLECSRDILWLSIVHYFMDVAIQSFEQI